MSVEIPVKMWNVISKSGPVIMITIPKPLWNKLQQLGVEHGNAVVWESITDSGKEVIVTLRIIKGTKMGKKKE